MTSSSRWLYEASNGLLNLNSHRKPPRLITPLPEPIILAERIVADEFARYSQETP